MVCGGGGGERVEWGVEGGVRGRERVESFVDMI